MVKIQDFENVKKEWINKFDEKTRKVNEQFGSTGLNVIFVTDMTEAGIMYYKKNGDYISYSSFVMPYFDLVTLVEQGGYLDEKK